MNQLFASFGLLEWKPWVAALLLPPVPLLGMLLLSWWWQRRRPVLATLLLMTAVPALWLSHCQGVGAWMERQLGVGPTLSTARIAELRRELASERGAVVVLGGGLRELAPEYGEAHLSALSMERLHYGLWLGRQLQAPVMFSGGAGWRQDGPGSEAAAAGRISSRDYGRPLRWMEPQSRDTRGNARHSLAMLADEKVGTVLLVTHAGHMRRAVRAFTEEAERIGLAVRVVPAPMGVLVDRLLPPLQRWVPTPEGHQRVRGALHEMIGLAAGA